MSPPSGYGISKSRQYRVSGRDEYLERVENSLAFQQGDAPIDSLSEHGRVIRSKFICLSLVTVLLAAACGRSPDKVTTPTETATPKTTEQGRGKCEPLEREVLAVRDRRNQTVRVYGPSDEAEEAGKAVLEVEERARKEGCETDNATLLKRYG